MAAISDFPVIFHTYFLEIELFHIWKVLQLELKSRVCEKMPNADKLSVIINDFE